MIAFSVGEEEISGLDSGPLVDHLAAWNYFMSIESVRIETFIAKWKKFIKVPKRVTNKTMEANYIGFNMWVKSVKQA